jgi:hypothetical protein
LVEPLVSINRVAEDRAADVLEMDPDLMGSARFRSDYAQAQRVVRSRRLHFADRFSSVGKDGHFFSVDGMAADRGFDRPIGRAAAANRQVEFFDSSFGEGLDQPSVRRKGFGGDKDS